MTPPNATVLWAIDPLADDASFTGTMARLLKVWTAGSGAPSLQIEPVYAASAASLHFPPAYFAAHRAEIEATLARRMQAAAAGLGLPGLTAPRLLDAGGTGVRHAAEAVLGWARQSHAEMIAVSSRAQGLRRLALGSFTESLVLRSEVPLLVVAPGMRVGSRLEEVIYPTDLQPGHERGFARALALARRFQARLSLVHASEYLSRHPEATYGPPEGYEETARADAAARRGQLAELVRRALEEGVQAAATFVDDQRSPGDAIVAAARERRSGVVVMISHRTRAEARLLGSVTRHVLRHSPLPVWAMHEEVD